MLGGDLPNSSPGCRLGLQQTFPHSVGVGGIMHHTTFLLHRRHLSLDPRGSITLPAQESRCIE